MKRAKRVFDLTVSLFLSLICAVPMIFIAFLVAITSRGPIFYWSERIGANNSIFRMPKFRTMKVGTPVLATHLIKDPGQYITAVGKILRRMSVDELPQLWNIMKGDMSFVGPRPALYNQKDLIELRTKKGIHTLTPGLTGLAQIHGRDELPIPIKVGYDEYYLKHQSFYLDLSILWKTMFKIIRADGISH